MPRRTKADGAKSRTGSQEPSLAPSPVTSQSLQLHNRRPMMRINRSSGRGASNEAGIAGDRGVQKSVQTASIWQGRERSDAADAHGKMNNMRRYLRAARTLYERQCRMKRPLAILKMKPNLYGLKSLSTFDALAVLVSPLRAHQILDDWTGIEIGLFEEAHECFGKDFHAIAKQLPKKSVKDTVAFYYIWKKHGSGMKARDDGNLSDDILSEPEPDVTIQTLKLMGRLQKRQLYIQDYFDTARAIYAPQPSYASNQKRQKVSAFGLQRIACFQRGLKGVSPLRVPSILDTWTPFEIRLFEVAIECHGKDFPRIADVTNKSCRDVVAFYYIWKNDSHYQVVKNRWERKNEADSTAKSPAD
uniref:SANT domain-containing protein n=1 Tax=Peronospora matthiolae TaxID=2874970 RepID=A0AAV1UHI9_9STRA